MPVILTPKVGLNRNMPRIWIEGQMLKNEGITPFMKYGIQLLDSKIVLTFFQASDVINSDLFFKTGLVSVRRIKKDNGDSIELPLIEIRMNEIYQVLGDSIERAKVTIQNLKIIIKAQEIISKVKERAQRVINRIKNKLPLRIGSLFHGGGIFDKAAHEGFKQGGIDSYVKVAIELEHKYIDSSVRNNPELFKKDSILIQSSIEDLNFNKTNIPEIDILIAGIPCTGASISGISKNKISCAEEHEKAGAMFFYFLWFALATNASIIWIENVEQYAHTTSMMVIRSVLEAQGYKISERVCGGGEFGALEDRKRLCVLAYSGEYPEELDLSKVTAARIKENRVEEILEAIPLDSERYKSFDYLVEKEKRDLAAGKGFARQIILPESSGVKTIGKGYAKCRSTEPMLQHPENESLYRIFTKIEHARLKTIPESAVDGNSETTGHEILGQSVIYEKMKRIALYISSVLNPLPLNCAY